MDFCKFDHHRKTITGDSLTKGVNYGKIHAFKHITHMDVIKTLTFSVASLIDQTTGTNEKYTFEGPVKFEGIKVKSDIKGTVEFMRIYEGFNVSVQDVEIKVELNCKKCLKPVTPTTKIDQFEKQFLINEPKEIE